MTSLARAAALAAMLSGAAASAQSGSARSDRYVGKSGRGESGNPHAVDFRDRTPPGAASPEERKALADGEEENPHSVMNRDAPKPGPLNKDELDRAEAGDPDSVLNRQQ
jgi:hypothetical protein